MPRMKNPPKSDIRVGPWVPPPLEEPEEGDQIVSYSELDTYRQCPLKHLLGYTQRWTKPPKEDGPLAKGSLWHEVMEAHYLGLLDIQNGAPAEERAAETAKQINALLWDDKGGQTAVQALIWWVYQGYVERWGDDEEWEILGVEVKFQRRLKDPQGNPTPYILKGKLDLVIRHRKSGKVWIIDHKSGAELPREQELDIDDQFGLYAWLLRESGIDVLGVIHNGARAKQNAGDLPENQDENGVPLKASNKKQTMDQRFLRTFMNRSEKELDAIARDAWAVAVNAYPGLVGRDALPLYTAPDPRVCSWKCDFLEAHLMARKGRNITTALEELGFEQRFERH